MRSFALPDWRRTLLLIIATAFLLQSYVTQTHIHLPAALTAAAATESGKQDRLAKAGTPTDQSAPSRDKYPGNDDPAKCPMCQAIGYAGQFVWPAIVVFVLPPQAASVVAIAALIPRAPQLDSHNWQGRAPPRR